MRDDMMRNITTVTAQLRLVGVSSSPRSVGGLFGARLCPVALRPCRKRCEQVVPRNKGPCVEWGEDALELWPQIGGWPQTPPQRHAHLYAARPSAAQQNTDISHEMALGMRQARHARELLPRSPRG
jgi:hypothetical protein